MNGNIAYCLGLHQTDGCYGINRNKRMTSKGERYYEYPYVTFSSTTIELVQFFKDTFNIPNKILESKDKRKESYKLYYRIHTHTNECVQFIHSVGYNERKQVDYNLLFESIKGYEWEFIQGCIEGDGSITGSGSSYWAEVISCSEEFALWLYQFISKSIPCSYLPYKRTDMKQMYRVRIYGPNLSLLLDKLSFRPPFLSAKMERLLNIVNEKG